jgi:hypothetical protein
LLRKQMLYPLSYEGIVTKFYYIYIGGSTLMVLCEQKRSSNHQ